jgi:small subunit ribosomal protein S18
MATDFAKSDSPRSSSSNGQSRRPARSRRKASSILEEEGAVIDYKNPGLLRYFVSERGKLLPRRMTGVTPKQQRALARAIKRARMLALMPFAASGE